MGLVEKLLDTYIPADEMGKKMGNQKESDCVSRLFILFGCYYFSSIFDIGIEKGKMCSARFNVISFCRLFLLSTYKCM